MRHPLQTIESTARKLVEKFTPAVLAKVAELPPERLKEGQEGEDLADSLIGKSTLTQKGEPFYSMTPDNRARVSIPLEGSVVLFREFHQELLGADWAINGADAVISIKGDRDLKELRRTFGETTRHLTHIISMFNSAHVEAAKALRALANNSIVQRARLEQILEESGVKKEKRQRPKSARDFLPDFNGEPSGE